MGIRKRTVTITLDDFGAGEDDINAKGATLPVRYAGLFGVTVRHDEPKETMSVSLFPLEDIDDDDELTYGDVLFGVAHPADGLMYRPREVSVDQYGVSSGEENVLPVINTPTVRVAVDGGTAAGEVAVDLFIETAGDQRF